MNRADTVPTTGVVGLRVLTKRRRRAFRQQELSDSGCTDDGYADDGCADDGCADDGY
jgi:hypothetical protein